MQVFTTNESMIVSATEIDDVRLNKMITEINQILMTYVNKDVMKIGHKYHPINMHYNTPSGIKFLLDYNYALCEEYKYRHGKIHMGQMTRDGLWNFFLPLLSGDRWDTDFKPAYIKGRKNVNQTINIEKPYELYRELLLDKWASETPMWTKRGAPFWAMDVLENVFKEGESYD